MLHKIYPFSFFKHWFKKYKINANYKFVEVSPAKFDTALKKELRNKNLGGFNITIPYKSKVIKYLDVQNKHAKIIGAVNCVLIGKKIKGVNTDWIGYLNSIKDIRLKKNKKIIILGFGGASQAIVYGLNFRGYKNLNIFNRSKKKIIFNNRTQYTKKFSLLDKYLEGADLIINTTPTNPIKKQQTKLLKKQAVISDIVYKPKKTNFIKSFKDNKKIYGISMLVEQAVPCFNFWFGFNPEIDDVLINKLNKKI
jgi:Shikimate 5-dehydrogenase